MTDRTGAGSPSAAESLLSASRSSDWSAREQACIAMGLHISNSTIANRLAELLDDPDIAVQVAAAEVLARKGGAAGLTSVLAALGRRVDDPDADHIAYKLQELQGLYDVPILQHARAFETDDPTDDVRVGVSEIEKLFGHYFP